MSYTWRCWGGDSHLCLAGSNVRLRPTTVCLPNPINMNESEHGGEIRAGNKAQIAPNNKPSPALKVMHTYFKHLLPRGGCDQRINWLINHLTQRCSAFDVLPQCPPSYGKGDWFKKVEEEEKKILLRIRVRPWHATYNGLGEVGLSLLLMLHLARPTRTISISAAWSNKSWWSFEWLITVIFGSSQGFMVVERQTTPRSLVR